MIADDPKPDVPREDAHDIAERLNKLLLFSIIIELADQRIEVADLFSQRQGGFHDFAASSFSINITQQAHSGSPGIQQPDAGYR